MNSIPKSFWIISTLALLWNLMGLGAYASHLSMTPEAIAELPSAEQALYEDYPSWLTIVFGLATICGTLGCVSLLLKKAWAIPLFIISLVAVIIQNAYSFGATNVLEVYGVVPLIMQILVILFGVYLIYFSRDAKAKGYIS